MPTTPTGSPDPEATGPNPAGAEAAAEAGEGNLAALLAAARAATAAERRQILEALLADGDAAGEGLNSWRAAGLVNARIDQLCSLLGLQSDEAALLLPNTPPTAPADLAGLTTKIARHLDASWETVAPALAQVDALVGRVGRGVLRKAEKQVNAARRQRGAHAVALVLGLEEQARLELAKEAIATGTGDSNPVTDEAVLTRVIELAEAIATEHTNLLGKDPKRVITGYLTGAELYLLSRCKSWVRSHATPALMTDRDRWAAEVWRVYAYCKRRGHADPATARAALDQKVAGIRHSINTLNSPAPITDLMSGMEALSAHLSAAAAAKGIPNVVPNAYPLP
jgi:hypothetical protein